MANNFTEVHVSCQFTHFNFKAVAVTTSVFSSPLKNSEEHGSFKHNQWSTCVGTKKSLISRIPLLPDTGLFELFALLRNKQINKTDGDLTSILQN